MVKKEVVKRLEGIALQCRKYILEEIYLATEGHEGGSLSAIDILVALYFQKLRIRPRQPLWPDRDRFILSKGHACPALYSCLARRGFFPLSKLKKYCSYGSPLVGTPEYGRCPGVEASAGPLGTGIGVGVGMALAAKLDKKSHRIYVMIGDGECDEGNIWESAMAAAHYKLSNLTVILDHNGLQIDGPNRDVMNIQPIHQKFLSFGWDVIDIDGHDFVEILESFELVEKIKNRPTVIVANTIKGKGIREMENKVEWHSKTISKEQYDSFQRELDSHGR